MRTAPGKILEWVTKATTGVVQQKPSIHKRPTILPFLCHVVLGLGGEETTCLTGHTQTQGLQAKPATDLLCLAYTGIPCFLEDCIMPLSFYERPTLVPAFANRKKSEEGFHFYAKKWK